MAGLTGMGSVKGGELEGGMGVVCGSGISAFIAMQTAMGFDFNEGGGRHSAEEMIDYIMQKVAVFVGSKMLGVAKDFMNILERRLTIGSDS